VPAGRTALVVLVPEADDAVGAHRLRHDANAARGVPAHVTVLFPFRSPVDETTSEQLARMCRGFKRFEARFASVGRFPGEVVWLAPEPSAIFAALLATTASQFPDCPPYAGTIQEPIPHLTVGENMSIADADELTDALASALPVTTSVTELSLLVEDAGRRWSVGPAWPLG
jgi:2'-5' RNA ligase superfamily protein